MKKYLSIGILVVMLLMSLSLSGCRIGPRQTLHIVSGSENETLEPLIEAFERQEHIDVVMHYKGSVDMMMDMQSGAIDAYDAVWPANSMWIDLGDDRGKIKDEESIMTSPIVIGVKKSLAESLGLTEGHVTIADLLDLIKKDQLSFMMTSATQSNSGACAYIGFINALLGNQDVISLEDLHKEALKADITSLLGGINRSSGSSGWLKSLFLQGDYDAMVNYEALIIETNQALIAEGREPLYVVYPYDGLAIADSPLAYVDNGDPDQEAAFHLLQDYLLSDPVQEEILQLGRRTGFGGTVAGADQAIFNPDWGIEADKVISGIRMPSSEVIFEALNLYQREFKKPSFTVYCLDYSGSMSGHGEDQLKAAMGMILDQASASQYMLQATERDVTVVIPFNDQIIDYWQVEGNNPQNLSDMVQAINALEADGGTDIYGPAMAGLEVIGDIDYENYIPAVVIMSDGVSNDGYDYRDLETYYQDLDLDIPIFSILFGEADEDQLDEIATLTRSRVFDGKDDLVTAFKKARGYN